MELPAQEEVPEPIITPEPETHESDQVGKQQHLPSQKE